MFHSSESIIIKDSKNKSSRTRARASTWSASNQHIKDNSNVDSNSGIGIGVGTGIGIGIGTSSIGTNTSSTSAKKLLLHKQHTQSNKLLPLLHRRQASNSSQISKLSLPSFENIKSDSTSHVQDELKVEAQTPTAGNTSRNLVQNRFRHHFDSADGDAALGSGRNTPRMSGGGGLGRYSGHGRNSAHSGHDPHSAHEQEIFPIPVPIAIVDMRSIANADAASVGASTYMTAAQERTSLEHPHPTAEGRDWESSSVEIKDRIDHHGMESKALTNANIHAMEKELEDTVYPPNINIATGPLARTWTDDSVDVNTNSNTKTSIKASHEHQNDYPHHSSLHRLSSEDELSDNNSISISPIVNQDTFDTPNSRGSKTSVVRFVDDIKTPGSYVRKAPTSLILEELNQPGDPSSRLFSRWGELSLSAENTGDSHWHSQSNLELNHTTSSLRPSKGVYSYHDPEDPGESQNLSFPREISPKDLSPLVGHSQGYERHPSFGASIDSLEYNSMRHMDSDTLNKISSIIGSQNDYDNENSQEEYDNGHGANNNSNGNDGNSSSPRGKTGKYSRIFEPLFSACWCFSHAPRPSWSRVSSAVVRHAPCFWFCLRRSETGGTDRVTLTRLNVICAVFALWQFGVGIFIMVVFLSTSVVDRNVLPGTVYREYYKEALTPNLWMMSGSLLILSVVGFVLFITMVLTRPVIQRVNLVGAIRFMWVLYWILPLQIFLVIALFDYHNVTDVWIKHWWRAPSMAWFRNIFCDEGTANEQCLAPMKVGSNDTSTDDWCVERYDAKDCEEIRESAISQMANVSYFFFYLNAIVGGVLVILLLLSLGLLEGIISAPIVQRSKETNISLWLTFPIIFCFAGGLTLLFSPSSLLTNDSGSDIYWIGVCYMLSGVTFTVSALLSWFM